MQNVEATPMSSLPAHSYVSGSHGGQSATYLPAYLMGDPVHSLPAGSRSWLGGSSPPRPGSSQQRRNFTPNTAPTSNLDSSIARDSTLGYSPEDTRKQKSGAPPAVGLMESLTNPSPPYCSESSQHNVSLFNQSSVWGVASHQLSTNQSGEFDANLMYSPIREQQLSGQPTQNYSSSSGSLKSQRNEETWVTVFGFQPGSTSYILEEFAQYGNILKHVISTNGNWMHLHYQSDIQARKALSKNGKIFAGTTMIGVLPCLDRTALEPTSPQTMTVGGRDTGSIKLARPTTIRPLVSSTYNTSATESLMAKEEILPEKNNSFFSKTMDFVFGW